jgi:hypothetical protein
VSLRFSVSSLRGPNRAPRVMPWPIGERAGASETHLEIPFATVRDSEMGSSLPTRQRGRIGNDALAGLYSGDERTESVGPSAVS